MLSEADDILDIQWLWRTLFFKLKHDRAVTVFNNISFKTK